MTCAQLTLPYWFDEEAGGRARWRLATVVALTLGTTGVRCLTLPLCCSLRKTMPSSCSETWSYTCSAAIGGFHVSHALYTLCAHLACYGKACSAIHKHNGYIQATCPSRYGIKCCM